MQYRPPNANLDTGCHTLGTMGVTPIGGRPWPTLLAIQLVRWRVSLLTGGILNVVCWSPNYAMQIHVLEI